MINLLLKAKHWQLFLAIFVAPFVAYLATIVLFFSVADSRNPDSILAFLSVFILLFLVFLIAGIIQYTWFYAVVSRLNLQLPHELRLNMSRFKIFYFSPVIYAAILLGLSLYFMTYAFNSNEPPPPHQFIPWLALIVPLHFFTIFCMFYIFYSVGITIKKAELRRTVKFEDYAGEFFCSWFFFIGVWILQPKINQLMQADENSTRFTMNSDDVL